MIFLGGGPIFFLVFLGIYQLDVISVNTSGLTMDETGIAWPSDKEKKFSNPPASVRSDSKWKFIWEVYPSLGVPEDGEGKGIENEHFIVWMRTAGLPHFRKLYGKIDQDIDKDITFEVDNRKY